MLLFRMKVQFKFYLQNKEKCREGIMYFDEVFDSIVKDGAVLGPDSRVGSNVSLIYNKIFVSISCGFYV